MEGAEGLSHTGYKDGSLPLNVCGKTEICSAGHEILIFIGPQMFHSFLCSF